jgi:hypothetical protein
MAAVHLRKYGEATTFNFELFETDGVDFKTDAAHASGDTKLMKDEGAEANTTNGFADEGQGYSIALTASEMEFARGVLYIADQGTKAWLDRAIIIETYGHASAQHAFDLDTAKVSLADDSITAAALATSAIEEVLDTDRETYQDAGSIGEAIAFVAAALSHRLEYNISTGILSVKNKAADANLFQLKVEPVSDTVIGFIPQ